MNEYVDLIMHGDCYKMARYVNEGIRECRFFLIATLGFFILECMMFYAKANWIVMIICFIGSVLAFSLGFSIWLLIRITTFMMKERFDYVRKV